MASINKELSYADWLHQVNLLVQLKTGLSVDDLDDYNYADAYDAGKLPTTVARAAIKNSGG